jgi:hypothetical protein
MTKTTKHLNLHLIGLCNTELKTTVHVGKLETILSIDLQDLSLDQRNAILAIIADHVENMDTSALLNKLAN